jgi:hypothetical protein
MSGEESAMLLIGKVVFGKRLGYYEHMFIIISWELF